MKDYDYLNWVFEKIRRCDFDKMEDLAPWSEEIPEYIKLVGNYVKEENNEADKLQTLESA